MREYQRQMKRDTDLAEARARKQRRQQERLREAAE
jgi:hypothetical protein